MSRMILSLQQMEQRMFYWCNHKIRHSVLDRILPGLTHLGGAFFTITCTLLLVLFAQGSLKIVGLQSLAALALSHIPIAIFKKVFPRRRPYLAIPKVNVCKNPLKDYSFPSGHTTAIFALIFPFIYTYPFLIMLLVPVAVLVALSRIYLGLHYPSDCMVGCLIGTSSAALIVSMTGMLEAVGMIQLLGNLG